jgi:hypothetical protein
MERNGGGGRAVEVIDIWPHASESHDIADELLKVTLKTNNTSHDMRFFMFNLLDYKYLQWFILPLYFSLLKLAREKTKLTFSIKIEEYFACTGVCGQ